MLSQGGPHCAARLKMPTASQNKTDNALIGSSHRMVAARLSRGFTFAS